jgi:hypothetical protein
VSLTNDLKGTAAAISTPAPATKPSAPTEPAEVPEYQFHPLAETFPLMGGDELNALTEDIRKNGMLERITLFDSKILDGRNRYLALKQAGIKPTWENFRYLPKGVEPWDYVVSENIQRRHLTQEQKREVIAGLLKADPTKSNRVVADTAKVSHHTVGEVRSELETTGQIAQLETTTGQDGKKRGRKGKGKGKGKGGSTTTPPVETEKIEYQKVIDAKTAMNAYSVFEHHLLDALQDLNNQSSFDHADEYAQRTIDKLREKLDEMQPQQAEEAEAEEEEEKQDAT